MGEPILLIVIIGVAIGLWVRRSRAMAHVVAEGEAEMLAAQCTLPGAAGLYDELRWLRHQLEADREVVPFSDGTLDGHGMRMNMGVFSGGQPLAVYTSSRSNDTAGSEARKQHAAQLRQALATLPSQAREALRARGVDPDLGGLPDRADQPMSVEQAATMAAEIRRVEAALTQAA